MEYKILPFKSRDIIKITRKDFEDLKKDFADKDLKWVKWDIEGK
jgi:hypothetical protein